jgi:threonine synthase
MLGIKSKNKYLIEEKQLKKIQNDFVSESITEKELLACIKEVYEKHKIIIDPHTAVGLGVLKKINVSGKCIVLATAHPCKFPHAINSAIKVKPNSPDKLSYILNEKENFDIIKNNIEEVKKYIKNKLA